MREVPGGLRFAGVPGGLRFAGVPGGSPCNLLVFEKRRKQEAGRVRPIENGQASVIHERAHDDRGLAVFCMAY